MDKKIFGQRIKTAREKIGITKAELAKRINTSRSQITRWERGDILPVVDKLFSISKALEVDPNYLILGETMKQHITLREYLSRNKYSVFREIFDCVDYKSGQQLLNYLSTDNMYKGYLSEIVGVHEGKIAIWCNEYKLVGIGWTLYSDSEN